MKYLRVIIFTLLLAFLATPLVALASNITNARYWAQILVSNNSTAATNVATTVSHSLNTTTLINGGYIGANASDCVMRSSSGADLPFMPGWTPAGFPWCVWVPSIGANSYLTDILYTANSTGGEIRYFPATGGMTTNDSASLEPGDNFTYEMKGWIDTTVSGNIVSKAAAISVSADGSENITAAILEASTSNATQTVILDGAGFADGAFTLFGKPTQWEALQTDDVDVSYCERDNLAYSYGYYNVEPFPVPEANVWSINSVNVTWRHRGVEANDSSQTTPRIRLGGVDVTGVQVSSAAMVYATASQLLARPGGGSWTYADMASLQASIGIRSQVGGRHGRVTLLTLVVSYTPTSDAAAVSASGVSSGEHEVKVKGQAVLNLDGTGDYVDCGQDYLSTNQTGTLLFWIEPSAGPEIPFSYSRRTDDNNYIYFFKDAPGTLTLSNRFGGAPTNSLFADANIIAGSWNHIAVTSTGSAYTLTVNNVTKAAPTNDSGDWFGDQTGTIHWNIGALVRTTVSSVVTGNMSEVKVYDRVLTPQEITDDYNGVAVDSTGLIGWWDLSEGAGPTAHDSSGVGITHTGTIINSNWGNEMLRLYIDDMLEDVDDGETVPDNASDLVSFTNDCVLYAEYQDITIGGVQQQRIEWEYSDNFTDLSGSGHWAIPTFRTASSDADVSANITSFLPVSEAEAPPYVLGEAPPFIDAGALIGNITAPFTIVPPAGGFPLAGVIAAVATATSTPAQLPLLLIAVIVILAASLTISALIRQKGSGSIIIKIVTITAVTGIFIALKNFGVDFWMLGVFLVLGIALAMGSRQISWS